MGRFSAGLGLVLVGLLGFWVGLAMGDDGAAATQAGTGGAAAMPRYQFKVGEELVYEATGTSAGEGDARELKERWAVWVTGEHRGGGWDVLIKKESSMSNGRGGDAARGSSWESLVVGTIREDGKFESEGRAGEFDPAELLVQLPADEGQASKGYTFAMNGQEVARVAVAERGAKLWKLRLTREGAMTEVYDVHKTFTATFDAEKGLLTAMEGTTTQGWGAKSKSTMRLALKENQQHDEQWVQEAANDAQVASLGIAKYFEEMQAAGRAAGEEVDKHLKAARDAAETALGMAKTAEVRAYLDSYAGDNSMMAKHWKKDAERRALFMDKPAEEWELEKVGGGKVALKDLRGKVVVLDFWFRGCGSCILAMPQVKQLAEDYKDRGVVVLGMNTDSDVEDAKFVIDKMKLSYATLRAPEGLPGKYGVQGFPTLVIVDQAGVVRGMHVGYSAELRKVVGAELEGLVKK